MSARARIAPDRIRWVRRQTLDGADLRAAIDQLDAQRARHVRGAHRTWGVAFGLDVHLLRLPVSLVITPGLAYDAWGRELLVPRAISIPIDEPLSARHVVVALRSAGDRCVPDAEARLADRRDPLRQGVDVVLAEVDLALRDVDMRRRPHVASMAPPHIVARLVRAGSIGTTGNATAFSATIDTTDARFGSTPFYLVQPMPAAGGRPAALGPLVAIRDATVTSFVVDVRYAARSVGELAALRAGAAPTSLPFALSWMGVEPAPQAGAGAAPDPDCPCLL